MKPKAILRADAGVNIGYGHFIRSLALADMLKEDFDCTIVTQSPTAYQQAEASKVCKLIGLPADETKFGLFLDMLAGDEIVVLDNYFFDTSYQQTIKNKGCKLVCIDDIHAQHFVADVVINHSPQVILSDYSVESYTKCLLGTKYVLLRKPFLEMAGYAKPTENENVIICLGGADPDNCTLQVLEYGLRNYSSFNYFVVLGDAFIYKKELEKCQSEVNNVKLLYSLDKFEMSKVMQNCYRAICSPSTVSLEFLCSKGELYLKCIADNQINLYHYFLKTRIGFDYTEFIQNKSLFNKSLVSNLIDGRQQERFIKTFNDLR